MKDKKYNIIFFGTWGWGKFALSSLYNLPNINILKVFTKWDIDNDLKNQVYYFAKRNNLVCVNTEKKKLTKLDFKKEVMSTLKPDYIVSCCYDRFFDDEILHYNNIEAINIHPSMLPKYRGVKPLLNAIVNNELSTGVTIHKLEKELDAGEIFIQDCGVQIIDEKTFDDLYNEIGRLSGKLIEIFFNDPNRYIKNKKQQNKEHVSYAPRLNFEFNINDKVYLIKQKYKSRNMKCNV